MKKVKRYQDGGITINQESAPPALPNIFGNNSSSAGSYPFQSDTSSTAGSAGTGVNQTFNIQPSEYAGDTQAMKKGGRVKAKAKSKSGPSRGDGIAQRGRTRGRYV